MIENLGYMTCLPSNTKLQLEKWWGYPSGLIVCHCPVTLFSHILSHISQYLRSTPYFFQIGRKSRKLIKNRELSHLGDHSRLAKKKNRSPDFQETKYKSSSVPGFSLQARSFPARCFTIPSSSPVSSHKPRPDPSSISPTVRVYINDQLFTFFSLYPMSLVNSRELAVTDEWSVPQMVNSDIFFAPDIFSRLEGRTANPMKIWNCYSILLLDTVTVTKYYYSIILLLLNTVNQYCYCYSILLLNTFTVTKYYF